MYIYLLLLVVFLVLFLWIVFRIRNRCGSVENCFYISTMELHFVTESRYERDESVRISAFGPGMTAEREKARRRNTAIPIEAIKMQTIFKSIAEHHVDTVLMWYCRTANGITHQFGSKFVASLLCPIPRRRGKKCGSNGYFAHLFVLAYDVAYLLRSIAHFISFHFRMRIK